MENGIKEIVPMKASERVLAMAKTKIDTGGELNFTDKLQAISATATEQRGAYGPTPADTKAIPSPLPETVKGAIASAKI